MGSHPDLGASPTAGTECVGGSAGAAAAPDGAAGDRMAALPDGGRGGAAAAVRDVAGDQDGGGVANVAADNDEEDEDEEEDAFLYDDDDGGLDVDAILEKEKLQVVMQPAATAAATATGAALSSAAIRAATTSASHPGAAATAPAALGAGTAANGGSAAGLRLPPLQSAAAHGSVSEGSKRRRPNDPATAASGGAGAASAVAPTAGRGEQRRGLDRDPDAAAAAMEAGDEADDEVVGISGAAAAATRNRPEPLAINAAAAGKPPKAPMTGAGAGDACDVSGPAGRAGANGTGGAAEKHGIVAAAAAGAGGHALPEAPALALPPPEEDWGDVTPAAQQRVKELHRILEHGMKVDGLYLAVLSQQDPGLVKVAHVDDPCHPVYNNPFIRRRMRHKQRMLLYTRRLPANTFIAAYFGDIKTVKENDEYVLADETHERRLRDAYTHNFLFTEHYVEDAKKLLVVGDTRRCIMTCANEVKFWGYCKDLWRDDPGLDTQPQQLQGKGAAAGPVGQAAGRNCTCKQYDDRAMNATSVQGFIRRTDADGKPSLHPVMLYVTSRAVKAEEEVLLYWDKKGEFFRAITEAASGYQFHLGVLRLAAYAERGWAREARLRRELEQEVQRLTAHIDFLDQAGRKAQAVQHSESGARLKLGGLQAELVALQMDNQRKQHQIEYLERQLVQARSDLNLLRVEEPNGAGEHAADTAAADAAGGGDFVYDDHDQYGGEYDGGYDDGYDGRYDAHGAAFVAGLAAEPEADIDEYGTYPRHNSYEEQGHASPSKPRTPEAEPASVADIDTRVLKFCLPESSAGRRVGFARKSFAKPSGTS
eukprot:XP_001697892.1 predicted protein [Chlamydomonas reinhardtii]